MKRLLFLLALTPGCAATSLLGYKLSPDFPDDAAKESVSLPGLRAPVAVTLDAAGVPHLEAQDLVDLARAHGFMQGRARFFQLDMMRRLARGRVSELVGEQPLLSATTLEYDRTMRGWEIEARATADFARMPADQLEVLRAFADGVNEAMRRKTPLEYRLLGVTPEPWEPTDTLAVGVLNVWSITHNYQQEAARLLFAMSVGLERMEAIYPNEPMRGGRTVQARPSTQPLPPAVAEELRGMFPVKLAQRPAREPVAVSLDTMMSSGASNAWVVSGARTQSGRPMVANDPHLSHLLPGMMVQVHLKAPGLDVIGVTVPGWPWVLAGHNERVAWGMTSTMADVIDLVVEQVDPSNPGRVLHEGAECPITSREELLRARDGSSFVVKKAVFRRTCNGPLLNDLQPALFPPGSPLVAVRWRVEGLERSLGVTLKMDQARSAEELGQLIADMPSTYNTWTIGDVDGHIGSYPSGAVPVRPNHRGTFPVPGWSAKYEWTEWVKGDRLPHALDPEDGVLAHANNTMAEPGSPDFARLQVDAAPPFRFERIVALAKATPKHDVASFKRMLVDTYSLRAKTVAPFMLEALGDGAGLTPRAKTALGLVRAWDFDARADRPEAAIFFATYRHAVVTALQDELPPPAVTFFLAQRYSTNTCDLWFEREDHPVWDDLRTPAVETRREVVTRAFEAAVEELARTMGGDVSAWRWGELHWHRPMHAFGAKGALDGTVNLERMPAGGELDSIWKTHFDLGNERAPFKVVAGPVYRSVMDLADLAHAWWVTDTGTSGWPLSPHYGDQYDAWRRGELMPMLTDIAEIRRGPHGELSLVP